MAAEFTASNAGQINQNPAPGAVRGTKSAAISAMAPVWPAVAVAYGAMLPVESGFYIGPLWMGFYRLILIGLIPIILINLIKGHYRTHWLDGVMLVSTLWLPVSFWANYDLSVALEAGGSQFIDMFLAYLIGRIFISDMARFKLFLKTILPGLAIIAFLLMAESITGRLFVRNISVSIFGATSETAGLIKTEYRLGLLRAYGPFAHPIHAGIFLASFLPLYYYFFKTGPTRWAGMAASCFCIFTLSSAGTLGIMLNVAFLLIDRGLIYIKEFGWRSFLVVFAFLMVVLHFVSQNGIIAIVYRYLMFNPSTGYYRALIWEFASADVWANPWFGIGYEEYTRPEWMGSGTIDAHYLAMAVKYGLFPAVFYFALAIAIIVILGRQSSRFDGLVARNVLFGLAISLAMLLVLLFTVTIWGSMLAWFNLMLGMFLSVALAAQRKTLNP